ncbi:delta(14)-sterol reductase TM7SF2-like isoform X2 [Lineus longissimus]|uniref:delta(14)-sterol reductase TM7SF2-like isoform X2 n=1 Tax=Lineus longissimus TaxID=88925 RepID=UPI002B4E94B5
MPAVAKPKASEASFRTRSKSPARKASPARGRRSRSKSRGRGRPRSKSRGGGNKTPTRQEKPLAESPSPTPPRQSRRHTGTDVPPPAEPAHELRAVTPTRHSLRIAAKQEPEVVKPLLEEMPMETHKRVGKTKEIEFGGPIGAAFMTLLLPTIVYYVNMACTKNSCTLTKLPPCSGKWSDFFDLKATLVFLGWFAFQAVLAVLPFGQVVEGQLLRSGKKLSYRCNGFLSLLISMAAFAVAVYFKVPVVFVYDKFLALMTTAIIFSFVLSMALYFKARHAPNHALAAGANTGHVLYDLFMGHELNPRIGSLDLKFFCELRPGLIGWVMINLCFIAKDCIEHKAPSYPLLMVVAFQTFYVADALWFEEAILTTMDITTEGFGYMLAFGDLAWVPFLYCLQTRYLVEHTILWSLPGLAVIFLLNLTGYIIFRGSNSQKNEFRKNPYNPALTHLESMPTSAGKRLLVSGWWGLCRHPNYLGDLIMALAWSLPCGFAHLIPYWYPIYFLILLIHREYRDEHSCQKKYGKSWDRYCERVKYRIFPFIF